MVIRLVLENFRGHIIGGPDACSSEVLGTLHHLTAGGRSEGREE
jgi:hypothetical protein